MQADNAFEKGSPPGLAWNFDPQPARQDSVSSHFIPIYEPSRPQSQLPELDTCSPPALWGWPAPLATASSCAASAALCDGMPAALSFESDCPLMAPLDAFQQHPASSRHSSDFAMDWAEAAAVEAALCLEEDEPAAPFRGLSTTTPGLPSRTNARETQKRFRVRQKDNLSQLQESLRIKSAAVLSLSAENEELRIRSRVLARVVLVRDRQIETLTKLDEPEATSAPPAPSPPEDEDSSYDSDGTGGPAPPGVSRPHRPACPGSAATPLGYDSDGTGGPAPPGRARAATPPAPPPPPPSSTSSSSPTTGARSSYGVQRTSSLPTAASCATPLPQSSRPAPRGSSGASAAAAAAAAAAAVCDISASLVTCDISASLVTSDLQTMKLVEAYTGKDACRLWVAFINEASACLGLLGSGCNGKKNAVPPPSVTARLNSIVCRVASVVRHIVMIHPAVRDSLVGMDLETGQQATESVGDAHWESVVATICLTPLQRQDVTAMYTLFRKNMEGILHERRAILEQLSTNGSTVNYADGSGREEASSFVFRGSQPTEVHLVDLLDANMRKERRLSTLVHTAFHHQLMPIQYARAAVNSYPRFPDGLAMQAVVAHAAELPQEGAQPL